MNIRIFLQLIKKIKYLIIKRNFPKRRLLLIFSGIILSLLLIGIFTTPAIQQTITQATTKQPEAFTELYFENHNHLPRKILLDEEYTFSFTIHNLENNDTKYYYDIYADFGGTKQYIEKESSVFIKNGQSIILTPTFTISETFSKMKIVVNLVDKNQQIAFWVYEEEPTE